MPLISKNVLTPLAEALPYLKNGLNVPMYVSIMYTGLEIPRARGGRGHICIANGEVYLQSGIHQLN